MGTTVFCKFEWRKLRNETNQYDRKDNIRQYTVGSTQDCKNHTNNRVVIKTGPVLRGYYKLPADETNNKKRGEDRT